MVDAFHRTNKFQSYAAIIESSNAGSPAGKSLRARLLSGFTESTELPSADGLRTITVHNIPLVVKVEITGSKTAVLLPNDHHSICQLESALDAERNFLKAQAKAAKTSVAEIVANGPKPAGQRPIKTGQTPS